MNSSSSSLQNAVQAIESGRSLLLLIDFQERLLPAISDARGVLENAQKLLRAAEMLDIPILFTEQNPYGLGNTLPELAVGHRVIVKQSFNACGEPEFIGALMDRPFVVVAGCEGHVCVLQTALGLLGIGRRPYVVRDAVGTRHAENKETAIRRMERSGAEIVTTEMVIFEWLARSDHQRFRETLSLIR